MKNKRNVLYSLIIMPSWEGIFKYDPRLPDGQGKTITDFKSAAGQQ
ncbi:hypothetical protein [Flavobacterium undicola]|nr:hypothetical protein [Flavobacterium undicola]MBA0883471.1 hypothetical protein [Flavobacterium undicola]